MMQININSKITGDIKDIPVQKALQALERDLKNTCKESSEKGLTIRLILAGTAAETDNAEESISYDAAVEHFTMDRSPQELTITSFSSLGLIYGIYHISRTFLKVHPFWFFNEQELVKEVEHVVPEDYHYESRSFRVRFRGWFINDEVLFDGWREKVGENFPWEMAFEALLRCGGNMTIPGTDHNAHRYKSLARDYGLWITHHHAEPLGAEMFARAYPELDASFKKYPDLFRGLWKKAIEDQKTCKVIWNLGFRGQGDRPFWADDSSYDTPQARGQLMSDIIMEQYNLVKESDPDAICCTNLYGETMELYRDGYLKLPEDVIMIWADNGFGKMVSRRQNNHNPRVYALPSLGDEGAHGIYYHASFYDLQAAGQMTMLPNSTEFVAKELYDILDHSANDFWIINSSNVKMHTYYLDLIARMWQQGTELKNASPIEVAKEHNESFCRDYFGDKLADAAGYLYGLWPKYAVSYGSNEDDHAGEQFSNHGSRVLVSAFISNFNRFDPVNTRADMSLEWICPSDKLLTQVKFYLDKFKEGANNYREYLDKCKAAIDAVVCDTSDDALIASARALDNNLVFQVEYMYYSNLGALFACQAILACLEGGDSGDAVKSDFLSAFYEAGVAAKAFREGYYKMRGHEYGIWEDFYKNDCEADIRQSAILMESLMSYLRVLGDGPHFYQWQRRFQSDAGGDRILLILRLKEHLTDMELWDLMNESKENPEYILYTM